MHAPDNGTCGKLRGKFILRITDPATPAPHHVRGRSVRRSRYIGSAHGRSPLAVRRSSEWSSQYRMDFTALPPRVPLDTAAAFLLIGGGQRVATHTHGSEYSFACLRYGYHQPSGLCHADPPRLPQGRIAVTCNSNEREMNCRAHVPGARMPYRKFPASPRQCVPPNLSGRNKRIVLQSSGSVLLHCFASHIRANSQYITRCLS